MSVRVDQAGQADLATEIDDRGAALRLNVLAELIDFVTDDSDRNVLACGIALAVIERAAADIGDRRRNGHLRLRLTQRN